MSDQFKAGDRVRVATPWGSGDSPQGTVLSVVTSGGTAPYMLSDGEWYYTSQLESAEGESKGSKTMIDKTNITQGNRWRATTDEHGYYDVEDETRQTIGVIEISSREDAHLIAEAFNAFTETGMTPRELGDVYRLAKAWHDAQSFWNDAMDSRDPDEADRADAAIAKTQGELFAAMGGGGEE